jgi:S1-C subfamily serine protease
LTCAHLLNDVGEKIGVVTNMGSEYSATALGRCPELDIAVLRIENPEGQKFRFARRNMDETLIESWCVIAGYPANSVEPVLRLGRMLNQNGALIVSTGRNLGGDSGGAIFNMSGELIGVNKGGSFFESHHTPIRYVNENLTRLIDGEFWRVIIK